MSESFQIFPLSTVIAMACIYPKDTYKPGYLYAEEPEAVKPLIRYILKCEDFHHWHSYVEAAYNATNVLIKEWPKLDSIMRDSVNWREHNFKTFLQRYIKLNDNQFVVVKGLPDYRETGIPDSEVMILLHRAMIATGQEVSKIQVELSRGIYTQNTDLATLFDALYMQCYDMTPKRGFLRLAPFFLTLCGERPKHSIFK